jgi:exopolysaccharide production protein ExoQ
MPPSVAAIIFATGIVALFMLDRGPKTRSSWALWLPIVWLLIIGSRHVSVWLGVAPAVSSAQYLEGSPLDRSIYLLLLAGGMVVLVGRREAVASLLRRNRPIVLFVLYCGISVIWSDFPGVAFKRWVKSLGDYVMILILLTEDDGEIAVKQVLAKVGFVLLPLSVLLIKYYPSLGRAYASHWVGTQFFIGVASDKNMLGMACMVFGFAAAWRVIEAWSARRRDRTKVVIVHGTILAMGIWLLKLSDSATSLACFGLTSALITVHTFSDVLRKCWVLHLSVAAIVLVYASVLFLGVGDGLLSSLGRDPTLTGRTDIWDVLLEVPINPVVGTGFESFWLGKRLEHLWAFPIVYGINEAHNGYLEMFLNLGWIGVAFLAVLLWTGYKHVLRSIERNPEAGRLRLGYFVIAVVYNFTEAGIRSLDLVWIAFLLATIAVPQSLWTQVSTATAFPISHGLEESKKLV